MKFFNKFRSFFIGILLFFVLFYIFSHISTTEQSIPKSQKFWQIQAVDTSKYSRDHARDGQANIPLIVTEAAKLNITHIALDTPYDNEFIPVLTAWVKEARKNNLKVWFRGNFSSWEGWFGYEKFSDPYEHNQMTYSFITKHPELFQDGDIFTPVPEPENGGFGDPRGSDEKIANFDNFLKSSYDNCVKAFQQINKNVGCGYFSTNGDIAKDALTPDTIAHLGNIIVIDHYVNSSKAMLDEINILSQKFPDAKIILGEFGAPIPDITGDMTQQEQESFIYSLLNVFYQNRNRVIGLDYWTLAGGSTSLLDDNFKENKTFGLLSSYFLPPQISGRIINTLGNGLSNVEITDKKGNILSLTNNQGYFSYSSLPNEFEPLIFSTPGYKRVRQTLIVSTQNQNLQDIILNPVQMDLLYRIRLFIKNHLQL